MLPWKNNDLWFRQSIKEKPEKHTSFILVMFRSSKSWKHMNNVCSWILARGFSWKWNWSETKQQILILLSSRFHSQALPVSASLHPLLLYNCYTASSHTWGADIFLFRADKIQFSFIMICLFVSFSVVGGFLVPHTLQPQFESCSWSLTNKMRVRHDSDLFQHPIRFFFSLSMHHKSLLFHHQLASSLNQKYLISYYYLRARHQRDKNTAWVTI